VHGLGSEPPQSALPLEAWHAADLREPEALAAAIAAANPDAIVHLAGQSSGARSFRMPAETFEINATGTWNLLEAARRAAPRARVLVVGTGEVYGPQPEGSRVSEGAPLRPVNPYALSKATADTYAEAASRNGQDVVRTRSFSHTGPGQSPPFVIPSWARQIATIESGGADAVLRVGNLEIVRDLCDVRDVVLAYLGLLERGRSGAAYNVCRGEGVALSEVIRQFVARARVPIRIERDPALVRAVDVRYLVGDPSEIERDIGWRAAIGVERTLDDVIADWRGRMGRDS
jgi:GDP-4-dehydro-6-deoxy-D-mannose reductase